MAGTSVDLVAGVFGVNLVWGRGDADARVIELSRRVACVLVWGFVRCVFLSWLKDEAGLAESTGVRSPEKPDGDPGTRGTG